MPPAGLPDAAALEARGATVGEIHVYVQNIFDLDDPREDRRLYRLANHLHVASRERIVREQLLFASGERLAAHRLAETERLLRGRNYLNDAWITPERYDPERNRVDLAVTVRDVWTLDPSLALGRAGGSNRSRFGLTEKNLFGYGTQLAVSRSRDVDRTSTLFAFSDSNLHGSWWQLGLTDADNSDGRARAFDLERPFYSLETRHAFGTQLIDATSVVSRYSGGQILDQFTQHARQYGAYFGASAGLIDGWSQRWLAGARFEATAFERRAGLALAPLPLPTDRRYAYPWLGWQIIEDRYAKSENLDLIGRTEDLYLGRSLYTELGWSRPAFDGAARALLARASVLSGWQFDASRDLFVSGAFSGRWQDGTLKNASLSGGGRYFHRYSHRQLFYASLSATATRALDADQQVLLGGDSGLRGYPLRFQGGSASALLTLENRVFTDWYPWRLLRVGGVAFFDAGRTWGRDFNGAAPLGLLKDIGLGMRFGNNRSALGNVVHVDLSYALDAPVGTKHFQVTIETKDRF